MAADLRESSLTRAYRDILRGAGPDVRIVHLAGPRDLVAQRLATRRGHFMPPELLDSQYAALEPLDADEPGITVDLAHTPAQSPTKCCTPSASVRTQRAQRG